MHWLLWIPCTKLRCTISIIHVENGFLALPVVFSEFAGTNSLVAWFQWQITWNLFTILFAWLWFTWAWNLKLFDFSSISRNDIEHLFRASRTLYVAGNRVNSSAIFINAWFHRKRLIDGKLIFFSTFRHHCIGAS